MNPDKWSVKYTNNSQTAIGSQDAWSSAPSHNIVVPIGCWDIGYKLTIWPYGGAGAINRNNLTIGLTLSTANNSESDKDFSVWVAWISGTATAHSIYNPVQINKIVTLTSKTTYYLNGNRVANTIAYLRGEVSTTIIQATCAYL